MKVKPPGKGLVGSPDKTVDVNEPVKVAAVTGTVRVATMAEGPGSASGDANVVTPGNKGEPCAVAESKVTASKQGRQARATAAVRRASAWGKVIIRLLGCSS
jgi:hypothetical protein